MLAGLAEGQQIVTGPFRILRELKDGAQVKPAKAGSAGARGGTRPGTAPAALGLPYVRGERR